jgi:succinate dehydrogenase/fumarate reductase flavoprotein subunit
MTASQRTTWDQTSFDVVVVGGGAAGLTAATVAGREGASVLLLEAAVAVGGTTAKSSGGFWVPNNRVMKERGFPESREGCLEHMALLAYPDAYVKDAERHGLTPEQWDPIVHYFDNAVKAVEDLEAHDDLEYMIMDSFRGDDNGLPPWFQTEPDPLTYGRLLAPTPSDEESAAAHAGSVVLFTARGSAGAAANPTAEAMRAHGATQGDGTDLVAQLLRSALKYGAEVAVEHRVVDVVMENGAVVGVVASTADGDVTIHARRGVVFASGGFEHNAALRPLLRGPIVGTCGVSTNRGDFTEIAQRLELPLGNTAEAWWAELPLEPCLESFEQGDLISQVYGDSMVVVDANGRRVVNEKLLYNERAKVHFVQDAEGNYPNHLLFMVFDDAIVQDPTVWDARWPVPFADDIPRHVMRADTLEELSARIDERLAELSQQTGGFTLQPGFGENLQQTVETFNGYAVAGEDPEFHRGATVTDRYFSVDIRSEPMPNNTMYPLADTGPYYAVILGASCLGTKGGPKISVESQVLDADGTPIPGLYGAGNCIASPAGEAYWGGGSTLGPAIAVGHAAGRNAAREPVRAPGGAVTA